MKVSIQEFEWHYDKILSEIREKILETYLETVIIKTWGEGLIPPTTANHNLCDTGSGL